MNRVLLTICMLFLITAPCLNAFDNAAGADKPAEKVYKNIRVLKGIKASQLLPTMVFIRSSLGVECSFCHVSQPTFLPELDQKPEKLTARKMMLMMRQINEQNFNGETWVTCATCHQGHMRPSKTPPLVDGATLHAAQPEPINTAGDLPDAANIFAKFETAIGGEAAVNKLSSRVAIADVANAGKTVTEESYQVAPNKIFLREMEAGQVLQSYSYDGSQGWVKGKRGTRELDIDNPETQKIKLAADFWRDLRFNKQYESAAVMGKANIQDHETYVVRGWLPGGLFSDVLYFDTQSGLLLRRVTLEHTALGGLPEQLDFSDYREVQDVRVPFSVRQSTPSSLELKTYTKIQFNGEIDQAVFAKPEPAPTWP